MIFTKDLFGIGDPNSILQANPGIFFIDIDKRIKYRQKRVPFGSSWEVVATNATVDLSMYQLVLVSGANIKTINGNSLLGSGDLTISSDANWGSIGGTLSAQTDLVAALAAKYDASNPAGYISTVNTDGITITGDGVGTPLSLLAGVVTSVNGTPNRITSTGGATPIIDIDSAYDALWQPKHSNLTSLSGLVYASSSFVKMTGANTFTLDTNTYQASLTGVQGDLIYFSGVNTIANLAKDANATRYLSNQGTSNNPSWNQINLANGVTGDLPFSNLTQGSARSVLGVAGNATADVASIQGTTDQVLRVDTAGTGLGFGTVATGGITNNAVTYAKIQNVSTTSKLLGSSSTTTPVQEITIGSGLSLTGTTLSATAGGTTIYSGNGSLSGHRTVDTATYDLLMRDSSKLGISMYGTLGSASSFDEIGLMLDFVNVNYILGASLGYGNSTFVQVDDSALVQAITLNSSNGVIITDSLSIATGGLSTVTLDVQGTFKFVTGSQAAGYVWTSDASGNADWAPSSVSDGTYGDVTVSGVGTTWTVGLATVLRTARTLWGQSFDGSANVTGSLSSVGNITGGASSMTIQAGTGASRTLTFQTTNGSSVPVTALSLAADQSAAFANTVTATTFIGALTGTASKATNMVGGNNTTLLGSIGYQSDTDVTTMLSPNTSTTKKFLTQTGTGTNGAIPAWDTIAAGDIPTLNQNTTGSAASLSISGQTGLLSFIGLTSTNRVKTVRDAADTILELGGSYTPTGTWTSLTMVTPVLGTPTSGTLTNCTGLPISTGVSGLGANVATFLATPSSANLAAAVTDETGSGALVFGTQPIISKAITTSTSNTVTFTSSHYGVTFLWSPSGTATATLPANGAAAGTWIDVILLTNQTITISAATADTLITVNDTQADSVAYSTANLKIGSYVRFISNGSVWIAVNMGTTTMTIAT